LWRRARGDNPGGGIASSAADQLRWAAFHLGDGYANGSGPVLAGEVLAQMREPTVPLPGSTLGDAVGLGWFVRDIDGVRTAGHGGTANGQFAELLMVPEHDFAVVSLANTGPDGLAFNQAVVRWALQTYLGVTDRGPEPVSSDGVREWPHRNGHELIPHTIGADGGRHWLAALMRPEIVGIDLGGRLRWVQPPRH
jgi:CubicO group peptidase (beta-lactamase class C family)